MGRVSKGPQPQHKALFEKASQNGAKSREKHYVGVAVAFAPAPGTTSK